LKRRDRTKTPWILLISELFEAAYHRHRNQISHTDFLDLLNAFNDGVKKNPRACGEMHPVFPDGKYWVYESPPIARLPKICMLYEIDDQAE